MKFFKNRWFLLLLRLVLGGVFIYAGVLKLGDPQAFADSIVTFEMLPNAAISILALTLPPMEIVVGIFVIVGWRLRSASFSVVILCAVFTLALVQALVRGLEVDCGCFGAGESSVFRVWLSLGRDLVLLGIASWIFRCRHNGKSNGFE